MRYLRVFFFVSQILLASAFADEQTITRRASDPVKISRQPAQIPIARHHSAVLLPVAVWHPIYQAVRYSPLDHPGQHSQLQQAYASGTVQHPYSFTQKQHEEETVKRFYDLASTPAYNPVASCSPQQSYVALRNSSRNTKFKK